MEVVSGVGVNAITGLGVWTARSLYNRYEDKKLCFRRLGVWNDVIFDKSGGQLVRKKKVKVPVIPGSKLLKELGSDVYLAQLQLGVVCWRGLISMYAKEESAIGLFEEKQMFRSYDEVGAYRDHVAACINVQDMYGYIFRNLNPRCWARVTLNKGERVTTNIGEYSMVYYNNSKWFHFVPMDSATKVDIYGMQFENLLEAGHNIPGIESCPLMKKTCTARSPASGIMRSKPWQICFESPKSVPDLVSNHIKKYVEENDGPMAGGAALPEHEEKIVGYYANFISLTVWQATIRLWPSILNGVSRTEEIYKQNLFTDDIRALVRIIERITWVATKVSDLSDGAEAAVDVLTYIGERYVEQSESSNEIEDALDYCASAAKVIRGLVSRLYMLSWTKEEWNSLDQIAWLAGIEDGAEGVDIEPPNYDTAEYPSEHAYNSEDDCNSDD